MLTTPFVKSQQCRIQLLRGLEPNFSLFSTTQKMCDLYSCHQIAWINHTYIGFFLFRMVSSPRKVITIKRHACRNVCVIERIPAHMWKSSRKLMNPSFNLKTLMGFIPTFNETSKLLVNQLTHTMNDKNFVLSKQIFACILDTTSGEWVKGDVTFSNSLSNLATFMGLKSDVQIGKNKEFVEGMERFECMHQFSAEY